MTMLLVFCLIGVVLLAVFYNYYFWFIKRTKELAEADLANNPQNANTSHLHSRDGVHIPTFAPPPYSVIVSSNKTPEFKGEAGWNPEDAPPAYDSIFPSEVVVESKQEQLQDNSQLNTSEVSKTEVV